MTDILHRRKELILECRSKAKWLVKRITTAYLKSDKLKPTVRVFSGVLDVYMCMSLRRKLTFVITLIYSSVCYLDKVSSSAINRCALS